VVESRQITTKKGSKMAFVKLADLSGELELLLFPKTLESTSELWQPDKVLLVKGAITAKDLRGNASDIKLKVESAREVNLSEAQEYTATGKKKEAPQGRSKYIGQEAKAEPRLYVRLKDASDQALLASLKEVFDASPGATDVVLVLGADSSKQIVKLPSGVTPGDQISLQLKTLVGEANVKLQ
jgi:DNA polymerase III alpha subunit